MNKKPNNYKNYCFKKSMSKDIKNREKKPTNKPENSDQTELRTCWKGYCSLIIFNEFSKKPAVNSKKYNSKKKKTRANT